MGRRRKSMNHLPTRVVQHHGQFYFLEAYRDGDGKARTRWRALGTTEAEMWRAWRELDIAERPLQTLGDVMDQYQREVLPKHPKNTQDDYTRAMKCLRLVFGHVSPQSVKPTHCYTYLAKRARTAKVRPNREIAVLAAVFRYAIELGLVDTNPTHGVRRIPEAPRERLPETWELAVFLRDAPALLRAYVPIKILTGLRQGDLLRLRRDQLTPEGILFREGKRGKRRLIEWSDDLRAAVDVALALRQTTSMLYVIATRTGQPYTGNGFRSIWQRHMVKVVQSGALSESFTEHDLRAVTATEAMERAQELLAHESARTTTIYQRSKEPRRVKPLR